MNSKLQIRITLCVIGDWGYINFNCWFVNKQTMRHGILHSSFNLVDRFRITYIDIRVKRFKIYLLICFSGISKDSTLCGRMTCNGKCTAVHKIAIYSKTLYTVTNLH